MLLKDKKIPIVSWKKYFLIFWEIELFKKTFCISGASFPSSEKISYILKDKSILWMIYIIINKIIRIPKIDIVRIIRWNFYLLIKIIFFKKHFGIIVFIFSVSINITFVQNTLKAFFCVGFFSAFTYFLLYIVLILIFFLMQLITCSKICYIYQNFHLLLDVIYLVLT